MATDKQQHLEEKEQMLQCALPIKGTTLRSKTREYSLVKVLGAGGFGITYQVSSRIMIGSISQTVFFVVKEHFLKGCYRGDDRKEVLCAPTLKKEFDQSKRDFIIEAERLNKLGSISPNIVKVNEHFEAHGTAYYVMEYLDGGDLQHLVPKNVGLSEGRALSIITPIANAVEHLHAEGLLHLDIKPDNIVMKKDSSTGSLIPVLIDFGIAKHFDKKGNPTSKLVAKGASEGYAPMEQYTDITRFAPEIDVYALGATLFFCVTGQNPPKAFDITSIAEITSKIPDTVGQKVRTAIAKAMQRNGFDRTPNMKAFIADIEDRYTLPIGYVLHGQRMDYRIVEVIGETKNFIQYKAIISNTINGNSNIHYDGKETPSFTQYHVYEWYAKGTDKRKDGIVLTQSKINNPWSLPHQNRDLLQEISEPIRYKFFSEKTPEGYVKAETFGANNTWYYTCILTPKPSVIDVIVNALIASISLIASFARNSIKPIIAVVAIVMLYLCAKKGGSITNCMGNRI